MDKINLIKLSLVILMILGTTGAIIYIQHLRASNRDLNNTVATLSAINASNVLALARLQQQAEKTAALILAWENDKKALDELRRSVNTKIKKEMQTNEIFNDWANKSLPGNIGGLFQY